MDYTIKLSSAENQALSYATISQQEWIDNAVHERARIAIEEIVKITVEKCLQTNTTIPGSKDEMVSLAFEKNWVKTAAERNAEIEAEQAAVSSAQQSAE